MTFARELERLLEQYTTYTKYPKHGEPSLTVREYYSCDECGQGDQEAVEIPHADDCLAGKVQEALLDG
tara:strand:+ start:161 stop:364 length:204 start_codon:yes stop_codon:yes gene_type:complete